MTGPRVTAPLSQGGREGYTYTAEFLPLAAGAVDVEDVGIQSDADFYCTWMTAISSAAGGADTTSVAFVPVLILLKSSASGEDWSDRPVPYASYFGRGDAKDFYPFRWDPPRVVHRNSNLRVQLTNLDGANAWRIRIAFHGYKQYE